MSFDGQVLCQRMLIGPWALTTLGAATAVAVAPAASMKPRRLAVFDTDDFSDIPLPPVPCYRRRVRRVLGKPLVPVGIPAALACQIASIPASERLIRRRGEMLVG